MFTFHIHYHRWENKKCIEILGRNCFRDWEVDGGIILKFIEKAQCIKAWNGIGSDPKSHCSVGSVQTLCSINRESVSYSLRVYNIQLPMLSQKNHFTCTQIHDQFLKSEHFCFHPHTAPLNADICKSYITFLTLLQIFNSTTGCQPTWGFSMSGNLFILHLNTQHKVTALALALLRLVRITGQHIQ